MIPEVAQGHYRGPEVTWRCRPSAVLTNPPVPYRRVNAGRNAVRSRLRHRAAGLAAGHRLIQLAGIGHDAKEILAAPQTRRVLFG